MISVLVVHSSTREQARWVRLLEEEQDLRIEAVVARAEEALVQLARSRPDVVLMEAIGDEIGPATVRGIMESTPVPIVAIAPAAGVERGRLEGPYIEAGAVAVVAPPPAVDSPDTLADRLALKRTVRAMAGIKVVRRWPRYRQKKLGGTAFSVPSPAVAVPQASTTPPPSNGVQVIAIGVSTGGPPALQALLSRLPQNLGVPILIVQHIARGFITGLAEWLNQTTPVHVGLASDGQVVEPGRVYMAPDGFHMGIDRQHRIALDEGAPEYGMRPAVSYLFRSVADSFGASAVGVLMTGMGRDGALELKRLHDIGALTIAQEKESCVVFGMSAEAIRLGAARYVLSPEQIGTALSRLGQSDAAQGGGEFSTAGGGRISANKSRAEAGGS